MAAPATRRPVRDARVGVMVTRPQPEAAETALQLEAMGYRAILAPALRRERLERAEAADLNGAQGAAFTSAAAARAFAEDAGADPALRVLQRDVAAYCVGERTADAARAAGFSSVACGPGDAAGLLARLEALDPAAGGLAVFRGREVATNLAAPLAQRGFTISQKRLYAAIASKDLPAEAQAELSAGTAQAALFLSARTVEAFAAAARAACAENNLSQVTAVCNSARTAAAADLGPPFAAIAIAAAPTLEATLDVLRVTIPPEGGGSVNVC
ncbi:MAG: uroporphyrinogen-III synthase [Pseudomonadota bacterium]